MSEPTATLSKDEIRLLVSEGVQDAFVKLGVQVDDPIEMQRDFLHLREWRRNVEAVKRKGVLAALGVIFTGLAAAAWAGFKAAVHGS